MSPLHAHILSETHKKPFLIPCRNEHFKISCDFARASFNCGATKIACGSADGTIYIWNVNGFLETTLKGHRCVELHVVVLMAIFMSINHAIALLSYRIYLCTHIVWYVTPIARALHTVAPIQSDRYSFPLPLTTLMF